MATRKASTTQKYVPFGQVKILACKRAGTTPDTQKGVNVMKRTRGFIRAHRAELIDAGWASLKDHEKGAPYGDVPQRVATMVVNRKVNAS